MELTRSLVTLHDPSAEGIGAMLLHLGLSKAVVEIHGGGGEPDRWWRDVTISECTGIIAAPTPDPAPVGPATEPEPEPDHAPASKPAAAKKNAGGRPPKVIARIVELLDDKPAGLTAGEIVKALGYQSSGAVYAPLTALMAAGEVVKDGPVYRARPVAVPTPEPATVVLTWLQDQIATIVDDCIPPRTMTALQVHMGLPATTQAEVGVDVVAKELGGLAQAGQIRRVSTGRYQAN